MAPTCPCGSGSPYGACCRPWHRGAPAPTAEALMRSRYTAFVRQDTDYLLATWHPDTRPAELGGDPYVWHGLEIVATSDGAPADDEGTVEFVARFQLPDGSLDEIREVSRFVRVDGRWLYLDGRHL